MRYDSTSGFESVWNLAKLCEVCNRGVSTREQVDPEVLVAVIIG